MKYKVSELEGAALDAAVAKAQGLTYRLSQQMCIPPIVTGVFVENDLFEPSVRWDQGGPIIERERITLAPCKQGWHWVAYARAYWVSDAVESFKAESDGPTALIAAMRAYVASKFGETVNIP